MNFETCWNNLTPYQKALAMSNIAALEQLARRLWREGYDSGFDNGKALIKAQGSC